MLSAPKLCMICSLRYLLEFYNLSTYFPVYRQIDNKTKCINPRIRDTNSFYSPPQCLSMLCMHLYTSVSVRLRVSADMPAYRVILHFGFFSCVFPIYLPQTCQTQGDQEKVKLRTNMAFRKIKVPHPPLFTTEARPRHFSVVYCYPFDFFPARCSLLCSAVPIFHMRLVYDMFSLKQ